MEAGSSFWRSGGLRSYSWGKFSLSRPQYSQNYLKFVQGLELKLVSHFCLLSIWLNTLTVDYAFQTTDMITTECWMAGRKQAKDLQKMNEDPEFNQARERMFKALSQLQQLCNLAHPRKRMPKPSNKGFRGLLMTLIEGKYRSAGDNSFSSFADLSL